MNCFRGVGHDFRYAIRGLRRAPGFASGVIALLAIGIGVNAAVFSVTSTVLFHGFPRVERNDRLVYITTNKNAVYYPDFRAWQAEAKSVAAVALFRNAFKSFDADGAAAPDTYFATEVTANAFGVLGVRPVLGRDFLPSDETPGAVPVVILRYGLWEHAFGKDPSIVGRTVRIDGIPTTVIGVMPEALLLASAGVMIRSFLRLSELAGRESARQAAAHFSRQRTQPLAHGRRRRCKRGSKRPDPAAVRSHCVLAL